MFDKKQLRRSFNSAAESYESNAVLQRFTAGELLDRLTVMKIKPELILDLGSGLGDVSVRLSEKYSGANIIQIDIAIKMLEAARDHQSNGASGQHFVCADAEQLPVAAGSVDLVVSNLMLQWGQDYLKIFSDVNNTLRPGGVFVFSTFGPSTLYELKQSWDSVDQDIHVNDFVDMHVLGDALVSAGMADPVLETDNVLMNYHSVIELMRDLKRLGAHNINHGRRRSLTGKSRLKKMELEYETLRGPQGLPSTYEVVYGHAWKPGVERTERQSGPQTISLESLKKSLAKITGRK